MLRKIDRIGHIPKADELHSIRDMLYIIFRKGTSIEQDQLLREVNRILQVSRYITWTTPTLAEYLLLMSHLGLVHRENDIIELNSNVLGFLRVNPWTKDQGLNERETRFFRERLLKYRTLVRFLEVVFCEAQHFGWNVDEVVRHSDPVKGKDTISKRWMQYFSLKDDRDPRAMLTWCLQTQIVENDEYSNTYYLISNTAPSYEEFLKNLVENYREVYSRDLKGCRIPDLRIVTCTDLHISLSSFDNLLDVVQRRNPNAVYLDRATSARDEVRKFGIKKEGFYFYYVNIVVDELK